MTRFEMALPARERKEERGAALISTLFLSLMLLTVGGILILTTSMTGTNAVNATNEAQAYYGAEAGLQAAMNVMRGNVAPDASLPAGTKMNFHNAVDIIKSNKPSESSSLPPRLSAWLQYSATYNDRVPITANYNPANGIAYNVVVKDPDNTASTGTPSRLLLQVTGYGPRGSIKRIEAVITGGTFDFTAPATVTIQGLTSDPHMDLRLEDDNDDCNNHGDDGSPGERCGKKIYSGLDVANPATTIPAFAFNSGDLPAGTSEINTFIANHVPASGSSITSPNDVALTGSNTPSFLQSADAARALVAQLKTLAQQQGRYFADGSSFSGPAGSFANPALTFIDGDIDDTTGKLNGGGGLLVITGEFRMRGNIEFHGLILVLGQKGEVRFDDSGDSAHPRQKLQGALVVAKFDSSGGFQNQPVFRDEDEGKVDTTLQYDSSAVQMAVNTTGLRVLGVREF